MNFKLNIRYVIKKHVITSFVKNKILLRHFVFFICVGDNDVMGGTLVFVETGGREKRVKPTGGENL